MLDAKMPTDKGTGLLFESIVEIEQTALPSRVNELLREGWVILSISQMASAVPMDPARAKSSSPKTSGVEQNFFVKRYFSYVMGRPR
jgi:hypothetical protein